MANGAGHIGQEAGLAWLGRGVGITVAVTTTGMGGSQIQARGAGLVRSLLHPVTHPAGYGQMAALQGVGAPVVLLQGVAGRAEPLDIVAGVAGQPAGALPAAAVVLVPVAIGAGGEGGHAQSPVSPVFLGVALLARHGCVPAPQGVTGLVVVEVVVAHLTPPGGGVATGAVVTQPGFVGILVAIGAGGVGDRLVPRGGLQACPDGLGFVAPGAIHLGVHARQREISGRMVELRLRFPTVHGVAFEAIEVQLTLMPVLVASKAGGVQTQEGAGQVLAHAAPAVGIGDVGGVVAFGAVQAGVLAFQVITGPVVVEAFTPPLPAHQFVIPPVVLHMAVHAGGEFRSGVQTLGLDTLRSDLGVAGQALVLDLPISEVMAFFTVAQPFQIGVSAGKISR